MHSEKGSCLPVGDGCLRWVGIVTSRDLLIWSLQAMQQAQNDDESQAA